MSNIAVELSNIEYRWNKNRPPVLIIPELRIERGERLFIHGPSGSGKSTLLSLLAGVNLANQGQTRILGQAMSELSSVKRDQFRADHIGFVFQMFNLIPYLSVMDNVTLSCLFSQQRRQRIAASGRSVQEQALRLLGHLGMADETLLHSPVTELSVGQQQRVAAARALIGSPELIIADEPTSALDSDMRQTFIELLFRECSDSGATLLFVSHDHQLESLFPRHLALNDINQAGSPATDTP